MSDTCTLLSSLLFSSCLDIRFFSNSSVNSWLFRMSMAISHLCYFNRISNKLYENRYKCLPFIFSMLELQPKNQARNIYVWLMTIIIEVITKLFTRRHRNTFSHQCSLRKRRLKGFYSPYKRHFHCFVTAVQLFSSKGLRVLVFTVRPRLLYDHLHAPYRWSYELERNVDRH